MGGTRPYVFPEPGDTLATLASRLLPDDPDGTRTLLSWNLHLAVRAFPVGQPGEVLCTDIEEDLGTSCIRSGLGHDDPDAVGALLDHRYVHVGASDGGAHVGSFATYGDTGFLLSRYVRETGALRLEEAIKKITSDTATIWGLPERGLVREGYAADLVVFDAETIDRGPEVASDDFPGDGIRWLRHSVGVDAVVVNGEPTWTAAEGYVKGARAGVIATRS